MYQHPLERVLLYTDKQDRHEFNIPEDAWFELYELFTTTKYDVLDDEFSAVDFFNEVFYCLTFTYANEEAAEWLNQYLNRESPLCPYIPELANPQNRREIEASQELQKKIEQTNWYVLAFVWAILVKQKELPPHVSVFLSALERALDINSGIFYLFEDFPKEYPNEYSFNFDIHPQVDIHVLLHSSEEWKDATDDFDREVIRHIVQRFEDPDDKETIVDQIQNALQKENQKPSAEKQYSRVTHRKKANEKFLQEILIEQKATQIIANQNAEKPAVAVRDGFASYIIKEHDKVLNILMLVANMGKNQMPLLIKFIRAFQKLGYIRKDCLDHQEEFILKASAQFKGTCFDKTNVKRQIEIGERHYDTDYQSKLEDIVKYLDAVMRS